MKSSLLRNRWKYDEEYSLRNLKWRYPLWKYPSNDHEKLVRDIKLVGRYQDDAKHICFRKRSSHQYKRPHLNPLTSMNHATFYSSHQYKRPHLNPLPVRTFLACSFSSNGFSLPQIRQPNTKSLSHKPFPGRIPPPPWWSLFDLRPPTLHPCHRDPQTYESLLLITSVLYILPRTEAPCTDASILYAFQLFPLSLACTVHLLKNYNATLETNWKQSLFDTSKQIYIFII